MPCKIVTVFNEKGGSGKTTLSCQLANTLGRRGYSVLLADLDPQRTSTHWAAAGEKGAFQASVIGLADFGAKVTEEIEKVFDKFDFIIADCAPSVDQPGTWAMLQISDLALMPTRLSPPDLDALKTAKRLARRALDELGEGEHPRKFPVRVLANGVRLHMEEDRDYLALLSKDKQMPPLTTTLGDRRAYQRSMIMGSSVHAVPKNPEAVREVEGLADELLTLMNVRQIKEAA